MPSKKFHFLKQSSVLWWNCWRKRPCGKPLHSVFGFSFFLNLVLQPLLVSCINLQWKTFKFRHSQRWYVALVRSWAFCSVLRKDDPSVLFSERWTICLFRELQMRPDLQELQLVRAKLFWLRWYIGHLALYKLSQISMTCKIQPINAN